MLNHPTFAVPIQIVAGGEPIVMSPAKKARRITQSLQPPAKLCYLAGMRTFLFRVDQPDRGPFEKSRALDGEAEAVAYARQLLVDWPDCVAIDVLQAGELVDRLRPPRP